MKIKIFLLSLVCLFLITIINKQNDLIRIPKEERELVKIKEKIKKGRVKNINDGDSFVLEDNSRIRLFAIDAPELNQTCALTSESTIDDKVVSRTEDVRCGEDAKNKLNELIGNNEITCLIKGEDAYGRLVGECSFEIYNRRTRRRDKININKEMILSGNAVAFLSISDKYLEDENKAKQENRGIWATTFDIPSIYRKKNSKNH